MIPEEKMIPMTLTIDKGRHKKLKQTAARTRISMSEIVRIALDRLWTDLGDLNNPTPVAVAILFAHPVGTDYVQAEGRVSRADESEVAAKKKKKPRKKAA